MRGDPVRHDQQETPYVDAVLAYRRRGFTPFHTPGHKLGRGAPPKLRELLGDACLQVDVAMAGAVEDTRESTGLIHLAEEYAAEAWGADRCHFLVNGSTSGVHALVLALAGPEDTVVVPRNAHKSLLAGLIYSGARPCYVEPEVDPTWGIPLNVSVTQVMRALRANPRAKALFVTSPTYNGLAADLPGIAAVAHAAGVPFVVDQAWGPHLRFCPELPVDAMTAGADAGVVSTHKLISGITQSAVLLARGERLNLSRLESMVKMTQSTSPQVLMYASIDAARQQMATRGADLWRGAIAGAEWARAQVNEIPGLRCLGHEVLEAEGVAAFDPTRLTISALDLGHSGHELETILRDQYAVAVEAADPLAVILNVTYGDSMDDLRVLVDALRDYAARYADTSGRREAASRWLRLRPPAFTRQVVSPREAFFAPSVAVPLGDCVGRVSAEIVTPYPPGIPVLGPGEEIAVETVAYLSEAADVQLKVHGPEDLSLRTLRVVV
jgi:lysine decarboxylase